MLEFKPNWKLSLFSISFFLLFIALGLWQLERAEEKRILLAKWHIADQEKPQTISHLNELERIQVRIETNAETFFYKKKILVGFFDPEKYWLIEGKTVNGQLGYEVIMPFIVELDEASYASSKRSMVVFVNRGWVAGSPERSFIPTFSTEVERIKILGRATQAEDLPFVDEIDQTVTSWPVKVLEAKPEILSVQYGQPSFNFIFRMDPASSGAFTIVWEPSVMKPQQHTGYAVQWFLMAAVLATLFLKASTSRVSSQGGMS